MRSGTGTKSGEPGFVTFSTKAMMDCLALPSFHDGSGSAARATVVVKAQRANERGGDEAFDRRVVLMVSSSRICVLHADAAAGHESRSKPQLATSALLATRCLRCSFRRTSSRLKLSAFCRCGNSLNVARNWPT